MEQTIRAINPTLSLSEEQIAVQASVGGAATTGFLVPLAPAAPRKVVDLLMAGRLDSLAERFEQGEPVDLEGVPPSAEKSWDARTLLVAGALASYGEIVGGMRTLEDTGLVTTRVAFDLGLPGVGLLLGLIGAFIMLIGCNTDRAGDACAFGAALASIGFFLLVSGPDPNSKPTNLTGSPVTYGMLRNISTESRVSS
jgi:hypothetical protein